MNRNVVVTDCDASIYDVAKLMNEKLVGSVVVKKEGKAVGIVTEQDIARKIVAVGKDPKETIVKDVTEGQLLSVNSVNDIYDATVIMKNSEIKHLPVIDGDELVGIITAKDIIRIEPYLIEKLTFKSSLSIDEAKKLFDKF